MDEFRKQSDNPKMVAFGAAVQDVFLSGSILTPHYDSGVWQEEFKIGEKYELENITFSTGGGATNAAVTFARQGLESAYIGKVGDDPAGHAVLSDLQKEGVDISHVKRSENLNTGYSTLLLAPDGGRTIITYRGASQHFVVEDFDFGQIQGDWLYITSLAGNMKVLKAVITAAHDNSMKIALNPGKGELKRSDELKSLLQHVDVLTLNKEEIQRLVEGDNDEQLVRHCSDMVQITVMTDGPNGVLATDRQKIVKAGMYEDVPVIDRTGAGDAFGSGLVAMLARGASLAESIKFASANSTSVVNHIGAKTGILREGAELHDMPIEERDF